MADIFTKARRSEIMRAIKPTGTKPERIVMMILRGYGVRISVKTRGLPGRPDIVLPDLKLAVFVHGCFWHQHKNCRISHIPSSNRRYWIEKFTANKLRDQRVTSRLRKLGWAVTVVWECKTRSRKNHEALSRRFEGRLIRLGKIGMK